MPTTAANPYVEDVRQSIPLAVLASVTLPLTAEDEVDHLRVQQIQHSAGGGHFDSCDLEIDLDALEKRLVDLGAPVGQQLYIEVWQPPNPEDYEEDTELKCTDGILLFWGESGVEGWKINDKAETAHITALVQARHFDRLLEGPLIVDPTNTAQQSHRQIVINPEIDGVVLGNKSSATGTDVNGDVFHYMIDPESDRSDAGAAANGNQHATEWTLGLLVHSLQNFCNFDETYIRNVKKDELDTIFENAPSIHNFKLPSGEYLPKIFDTLLHPHGYGWFVEPIITAAGEGPRLQLRFFRFGQAPRVQILMQRPDKNEDIDLAKSNASDISVELDIANIANVLIAKGALEECEFTSELCRGWAAADDALQPDELDSSNASSDSQYQTKPYVWRKWVLNEHGGYNGLRTEITAAFEVSEFFGAASVPKRRRLYDCLKYTASAFVRRPPVLEWWNKFPEDGSAARWEVVPEKWTWTLLHNEGGILFTGDKPPEELVALGADAKLRITATIRGDTCLQATAVRQATSPNGSEIKLQIDVSDRFVKRSVMTTGPHTSIFAADTDDTETDARDDTDAITAFAANCRAEEDLTRLRATFTLFGLQPQYYLGDSVDKIDGRNLSLNRANREQGTKRYLQITSIVFDPNDQKTVIEVNTLMLKKRDLDTGIASTGF